MSPSYYQDEARSFLKELVSIWKVNSLEILDIEYIGEKSFKEFDVLENHLTFKRNNSLKKSIEILVSLDLSRTLFGKYKEVSMDMLFKNIIYLYNYKNPNAYLKDNMGTWVNVASSLKKDMIYKMNVNINGKNENIYFNMDAKRFFDL